jgi:hypothetical protein
VAIKPKPLTATAFVVDAYMNVLGLLGAKPGHGAPSYAGAVIDPKSDQILPREKFAIFTFRPKHGDPRGTSILRPAYAAWWMKWQVHQEYLKYLAQFAGPGLIGTRPSTPSRSRTRTRSATRPTRQRAAHAVAGDGGGAGGYRNGGILGLPFGSDRAGDPGAGRRRAVPAGHRRLRPRDHQEHPDAGAGDRRGRAPGQGGGPGPPGRARHAGPAGQAVAVRVIARDILRNFVRWNWGEDALPLAPKPSLGTTERTICRP